MTAREWNLREAYAFYRDGRNLKDVGRRYGVAPQTVHKRFIRAGLARCNNKKWTLPEIDVLVEVYGAAGDGPVDLDGLSMRLERHKTNICRKARELGYTNPSRPPSDEVVARCRSTLLLVNAMRVVPLQPALGHRHSAESRKKMSESQRRRNADPNTPRRIVARSTRKLQSARMRERMAEGGNVYSRARRGRRQDLGGAYFRSAWEANYARYLNLLKGKGVIADWAFEPDTFWFEKIRRGVRSYMPDFRVTNPDGSIYYVEVKGWMDKKSKTKLKRMAKYHPAVDLRVVGAKEYREIERKLGGVIPHWEHPGATVTIREAA